jgi:4-carboxymuconolactone decarboxylase
METQMRLSLLSSSDLSAEQRLLYKDMRIGIETDFKGFTAIDETGALIGPWNPWLRFPKFDGPIWELVKALSTSPKLPRPVREIGRCAEVVLSGSSSKSVFI